MTGHWELAKCRRGWREIHEIPVNNISFGRAFTYYCMLSSSNSQRSEGDK